MKKNSSWTAFFSELVWTFYKHVIPQLIKKKRLNNLGDTNVWHEVLVDEEIQKKRRSMNVLLSGRNQITRSINKIGHPRLSHTGFRLIFRQLFGRNLVREQWCNLASIATWGHTIINRFEILNITIFYSLLPYTNAKYDVKYEYINIF